MKDDVILEKSEIFAIRIIRLYQFLTKKKNEYVLSKQVLRSGTSIGANITEAKSAFSKKDFLAKMYIAFKECSETIYWLNLLVKYDSINADAVEIRKILSAITKTTRENCD